MRVNRPKITLSPWEVAPNVEIRPKSIGSFFNVRVPTFGPSRPVGAIKHPISTDGLDAVFLRFLDKEDEGNWVILEPNGGLRHWGKKGNLKLPWRLNHDEIGDYPYLGRLFNACALGIVSNDGFIITVNSYNSGLCMDIRDVYNNARFKLNSEIKLIFDTPFAVVRETLQREMALPDSDASFVLKWLALGSTEEHYRFAYHTQRGKWDELVALFLAVEALFPTPQGKNFLLSELNNLGMSQTFDDVTDPLTCRRYIWNMELIRYFQPFIPTELRHYTCVRDWSKGVGEMYHFWRDQTSAHEKIEAANLLFNWAQDKMSPKKLKLMLPY